MNYESFLESKRKTFEATGVEPTNPNLILFPFQSDIVKWALRRGRACLFEDCGLGKTFQSLEWAKQVPGDVLIVAPLNVAQQTIAEGRKLSINVKFCRETSQFQNGISITNYEMLERLDVARFKGVVLDESSILKNFDGKTRNLIIEKFRDTPFKLACTATPSPNDHMELGNHAEFVGAMTRTEMLSMFFVHDGGETSKWRLKGHAEKEFWKWVCSWAVMIRKPSDLGYDDGAFNLPRLKMVEHVVKTDKPMDGHLIPMPASSLQERRNARRSSLGERVEMAAKLVEGNDEQWVFWVNLNDESAAITKAIPGAVEVRGDTSMEDRERICAEFVSGKLRVLVSKASIFGFGMNFQNCARTACVGISDSYEELYQLIRRFWRFGQTREVEAHIIISDMEGAVLANIKRKEADATKMAVEMVRHMSKINEANIKGTGQTSDAYVEDVARGKGWELYLGDCVEVCKKIETESVGFSVFSPPFASLYTYSASDRDLGNVMSDAEFHEHFKFVIAELYRVMMAGRLVSFHCMDMPSMKSRDGMIGLKDFPAILIAAFQAVGFIYHSRVVIWKDPLIEATRTKALGLMHKQIIKDSAMCRQGLPDYLITMRKPGDNPKPIAHPDGFDRFIGEDEPKAPKRERRLKKDGDLSSYLTRDDPVYSHAVWRRYASPVWMDINQTRTLQKESARDERDERHICPLQLDVIERAIELWSNPGDLVLSPFAGIGSEGHVALLNGRRFVGAELKFSYFEQARKNLKQAESQSESDLFSEASEPRLAVAL